ncbi:MAG: metal-dependent hydrolase [Deltaproteobacteria bacterium]|nr:metal-dependent hydrolase [Deltaproteobacteria bacterium]
MNTQTMQSRSRPKPPPFAGSPVRQASPLPDGVDITVRHPRFDLARDRKHWMDGDPLMSRVVDALSMFFPDGEKFFIDSVVRFRNEITDPELKKQISAFAGQEAAHTAEHRKYNVHAAGNFAPKAEYVAAFLLGIARRFGSRRRQLAVTVALEHLTATLADIILNDPETAARMDAEHRKLLLWHAAEETEHKSVAFDVYNATGGGFLRRTVLMIGATGFLVAATTGVAAVLLWRDGELLRLRNFSSLYNLFFGSPGLIRKGAREYLRYFRRDFEPWGHDNSALLAAWKNQYAKA